MRDQLGVLADIHGNALALEAVLNDASRRGVTRFVNLGDVFYGPLDPLGTFRRLAEVEVVATVAGNQDRLLVEATDRDLAENPTLAFVARRLGPEPVAWLRSLPKTSAVDRNVLLCHGAPADDTTYLLEDVAAGFPRVRAPEVIANLLQDVSASLILCGHTHIPRLVSVPGGRLVVNPGSVGLPAYRDELPVPHRMESHAPHASYAILSRREGADLGWDVSLHRVAYDWRAAADQAQAARRNDWAVALLTGRAEVSPA